MNLSGPCTSSYKWGSQLVHATFPVFALGVVFHCEILSDRVVCCECNCYVRVFKYFGDVTGFLPDIHEPCPFFLLCMYVEVLFFLLFEFRYVMVWVVFAVGQDLFYGLFLSLCTQGIVCRIIAYRGGIGWLLFFFQKGGMSPWGL